VTESGPGRTGVFWRLTEVGPHLTGFRDRFPAFLKKMEFFSKFRRATGKGMAKGQAASVSSEEVLQVESKWSFLPIYPTYDQYVQRFMVMPQREGFHVLTRSVMKELRNHAKWMVLHDNHKKSVLFTVRVDVWHRPNNLPEETAKRAGLGVSHRDRLTYTYDLCKYAWSHASVTNQQYHGWLCARRARRNLM
jgi:hypothetical protein